jgi:hypothetical protein
MYDIHPHNGHGSVPPELENCPLCGQLLPNGAEAARIRAKLDVDARARHQQWEAEKLKIVMAARAQEKVEGDARFNILLQENAQLRESRAEEVAQQVAARMADKDNKFAIERMQHQQEVTRFKAEIEKLQRSGEQRTSNRLGEAGELEIFNVLKIARPEDNITRVPKGQQGADITQLFTDKHKQFGGALWEVKNTSTFQKPYLTKLLDNQLKGGLDWGVLVLQPCAFPPGIAPLAQPYEGVWLCPTDGVVPFMETLRRITFNLSKMKATVDDPEARRARGFTLFATGEGRILLQRINDGFPKLKALHTTLQKDVVRYINQSAAIYEVQQRYLGDVFDAIDRLTDNDDGNEGL